MTPKMLETLADQLDIINGTLKDIYFQGEYGAPTGDAIDAERVAVEVIVPNEKKPRWYLYVKSMPEMGWHRAKAVAR